MMVTIIARNTSGESEVPMHDNRPLPHADCSVCDEKGKQMENLMERLFTLLETKQNKPGLKTFAAHAYAGYLEDGLGVLHIRLTGQDYQRLDLTYRPGPEDYDPETEIILAFSVLLVEK